MSRPQRRHVLLAEGGYYVVTGVLPFASRRLFERITGPKVDWWLVETVGALVTAAGGGMLSAALRREVTPEITGVAAGCAVGLAGIDVFYFLRGRISRVYLEDASIQVAALAGLLASRD